MPSLRTVGVAYSWFELPHGFRHVSKSHVNSRKNASILKLAGNACACPRGNSCENLDSLLDRGNRKNVKTALRNCIDNVVTQEQILVVLNRNQNSLFIGQPSKAANV